jgi:hypothetical protein
MLALGDERAARDTVPAEGVVMDEQVREVLRAMAADLLRIAAWGFHDSNREALREKTLAALQSVGEDPREILEEH